MKFISIEIKATSFSSIRKLCHKKLEKFYISPILAFVALYAPQGVTKTKQNILTLK